MCRFALYIGESAPLSTTLFDPPRSLQTLAYDPQEMLRGHINVDGTGIAWWREADSEPLRYVTEKAPWNDPNLYHLADRLRGRVHLAAVRAATPGIPFAAANVAPFVHDGFAFAHNGWIGGYREAGTGRALLERLPDDLHGAMDAISDSLTLFMLILAAMRDEGGDPAAGVRAAFAQVGEVVRDAGTDAALNVVLTDGRTAVVARASVGVGHNSLYLVEDAAPLGPGLIVASEPLDPELDWVAVEPDHLLVVEDGAISTVALELP